MEKSGFFKTLICTLALVLLKAYRNLISPVLASLIGPGFGCRYQPTCSQYAERAIKKFGLWSGLRLTIQRIFRCHPWGSHGYDPVPDSLNSSK